MAQTNFTPILTYKSDTASAVPSAGNLTNSANGAELAVNTADKRLFTKDSGGSVVELGTNPSSLTLPNSTANGVVYANGSKVLTTGSALTFDGAGNFTSTGAAGSAGGELALKLVDSTSGRLIQMLRTGATFSYAGIGGAEAALYTASNNLNLVADGGAIKFNVGTLGSASEQMRLTSTGLGIGTSSPVARIESVQATSGAGGWFMAGQFTAANYPMIRFAATTPNKYSSIGNDADGGLKFFVNGNNGAVGTTAVTLDASGNLGLGVTPSAWSSSYRAFEMPNGVAIMAYSATTLPAVTYYTNAYFDGSAEKYKVSGYAASSYGQSSGQHRWYTAPSGTAGSAISFTQALTLNSSGNMQLGTTSSLFDARLTVQTVTPSAAGFITENSAEYGVISWNASTSGDSGFLLFATEGSFISRGSIKYNRGAGLTAYNTTSDYRAKDLSGPVTDSGSVIDSVPVYIGKMKGATQERPMFVAHETPAYAHTGEKDAVDKDGNPVYQQMDASALVPILWAELQSVRKRLSALEAK